ncbi:hypothetical protein E3U23_01560 [Erythrobacter litoralis]|nr:hypothetical protein [Erythrobacter litoralis]
MPIRAVQPFARIRAKGSIGRKPSAFKKVDVKRAIDGVRKEGLVVASVEIGPDGTIRILTPEGIMGPSSGALFDQWQDAL